MLIVQLCKYTKNYRIIHFKWVHSMEYVHVKKAIKKTKNRDIIFQAEIRKVGYVWWISSIPSGKERVRRGC